ncbi:uL23 family ribosomal protein [Fimbriimonas ginsengisoli]|uniref:Large ribosomal subunit protein uL23 n=1 Tax=Fimbriimonas ginsengisoli Gsoil 348 TaxID=661478 RepID=A0A068NYN6_FIMGI|nr:50S ribosomal protein L23 [Fimbriimonas ginsengisoli]AIE87139.1 LSU ribosomal protein L23P [Fimbriimonas ginsengisoli Gsoil 348]
MKNPHNIILRPHITEKSVGLSYGDDQGALKRLRNEAKKAAPGDKKAREVQVTDEDLVRKYTFIVARDANKIEIKSAIEAIYNEGKKADQAISVTAVRTVKVLGKKRKRGQRSSGFEPDRKKAIVTLAKGQMLEDYGV